MNVKPNIGIINAIVRITAGLTLLSWATAKLVKKPWQDSNIIIAMLAAMKVAEGILRYCPLTDLVQTQYNNMTEQSNKPPLKQLIDFSTTKQPTQDDPNSNNNNNNNEASNTES